MRNRTRPGDRDEQPERSATREHPERTQRVRVPKIQYRFLKELEQNGVTTHARQGALAMADKIKHFPVGDRAVMGSWERFTKQAIEEFKSGKGNGDERDRRHAAYAVLFSVLRDAEPAADRGALKQRIDSFSSVAATQSRAPVPQQQSLLDRERPSLDKQIDATIARLRALSEPLRTSIETSAREMIIEGQHTPASARAGLPDAFRDLRGEHNEKNTVHALTLAVVAKSASQTDLLREIDSLDMPARKEVEADARARLERYPPGESGAADVRKDATTAAVRDAIAPSSVARREALVLAQVREEIEAIADPHRQLWRNVGDELARDLA